MDSIDMSSSSRARSNRQALSTTPSKRHFTLIRRSRVREKASSAFAAPNAITTPSAFTDRITASVAAMTGGVSMTINLKFRAQLGDRISKPVRRKQIAGFGGSGPVGNPRINSESLGAAQ